MYDLFGLGNSCTGKLNQQYHRCFGRGSAMTHIEHGNSFLGARTPINHTAKMHGVIGFLII